MAHATTFETFIPSVEEALFYKREWLRSETTDRTNYDELSSAFSTNSENEDAFTRQCELIYRAYNQRAKIERRILSANYLMSISNLKERIFNGDLTLPDEIIKGNDGEQFVFAVMFCHHSNPTVYYACTGNTRHIIVELNKFDCFWNQELKEQDLKNYVLFHSVMNSFVKYYHIETLSHLELDIMLRNASKLLVK